MTRHALTCLHITQTAGGMHRRGTPPRLNGGGSPPGLHRRPRPLRTGPLLTRSHLTWAHLARSHYLARAHYLTRAYYLTWARQTGPPLARDTLARTLQTRTLLTLNLLTLTALARSLLTGALLTGALLTGAALACSLLVRVGGGLTRRTPRGYRPNHGASGRSLFRLPRARNAPRTANRTRGRPADLRNLPGIADHAGRGTGHGPGTPGNGRSANALTPRHHRRHHRRRGSHRRSTGSTGSTGRNRTGVLHLAGALAPVGPPVPSARLSRLLPIGPRPAAGRRGIPRPEGTPVRRRHSRNRPARPTRRPSRPTTSSTPPPSTHVFRRSPPPCLPILRRSPPPCQTLLRHGTTAGRAVLRRCTTARRGVIRSRTTAGGGVIGGSATAATGESLVLARASGEILVGSRCVAAATRCGSVDQGVAAGGRIHGEGPGARRVTAAEASRRALLGVLVTRGTTRRTLVGTLMAARPAGR
ncbi:hypothetical protein GCM10010435_01290 [Winogradskya consettensis]|uniref:Uncharacterized protein n=1 Tax=Winogradskya consettensis TaxID=113560 RepID=A0A919S819_9ACTN|nr:hypothetical protein [Actinoplanes consettensis]GIM66387.1 hypothetical protein Aco04nite_01660 [Actinoplanes consettensis]